ncbi:PadR family transcriptional regulator [Natrarchaeobaculum sulfurireducens]|uniref:Transcriptional regulator, PadR family n=1 Tax=Natrarchaeobaculum sulfurireducens TaxID=2044521 RepID=A0A346PDW3_9EURY|nr:helix-turn-helix transcriptional regulator [Natrarchaeobaculum sulfurireducens]AXR77708.1 Transcriptional regulator, PadR family [Natrarchaeobaculum sulfurireducens]
MRDAHLYTCDTPECNGLKEVITPDGYVCHDCADELVTEYEAEPELIADGGTSWAELTGFKRDVLEAIAQLERDGEETYGLAIKNHLEQGYSKVLNGRLYQNLDALEADGLLERDELDGRTNSYTLTPEAKAMLEESIRRRADACGLQVAATDGGEVT